MSNSLQVILQKLPEPKSDTADWLEQLRAAALKTISSRDYPNSKEESWKYTSLHTLRKNDYVIAKKHISGGSLKKSYSRDDFVQADKLHLVFINGFFQIQVHWLRLRGDGFIKNDAFVLYVNLSLTPPNLNS